MHLRQGQFSTYLKPLLIVIFAVLLLFVVQNILGFQTNIRQQESRVNFFQQIRTDYQKLINCLSVNDTLAGNNILLNQSKLITYEKQYRRREPPCAEDFQYGYNVTVTQNFLQGIRREITGGKVDLVFVMDTSGSMSDDWTDLCNVKDNVINALEDQGKDVKFTVYGLAGTKKCADAALTQSPVDSSEDWAPGVTWAANNYDWRSGTNKIIFPLSDECPQNGDGCDGSDDSAIDQAIQAAKNNDVTVYPIWGSGASNGVTSRMEQLADETGGKAQSKGSTSNLAEFIVGAASSGNSFKIGADTTCTLPSTTEYSGTVDLVFVADTSASYGKEWNTICSSVKNTIDKLEKKGLDANVSIYMATPDADEVGDGNFSGNDQGTLMFSGFDYVPSKMDSDGYNLPSCMPDQSDPTSDDVFAYKSWYGYGVTTWDGTNLDKYRPSVDHGLEAWGVAAKWVFEHHTFRSDTDRRFMFIFGDTYPTGAGGNPGHFREEGEYSQHQLDSDPEIVQNVTAWANKKDVTVHTFVGTNWEGNVNSHTSYGGPMGDAKELMKDLAKDTGGQFHKYQDVQNIPDKIKELFKSIQTVSGGSCKNRFQFGEMKGSTGSSLRNSLTLSYPISIWQNEDLQTPGTLRIELRDGDLETLAGAINRVIRRGNRRGEQINATLRYVNERRVFTDPDHQVERPTTTTYHLENPSGSGITYDDQLIIGVNGQMKVNLTSSGQTTINNVESKTSFKAYRGASVQVIGVNRKADSLHIDPLQIVCQTGCSGGPQQLIQNARDATKGDGVYEPKFKGIGAFYHNFTTVNIGPTSATEKPALCIATDTSPHCITLRATAINTIELGPGSHLLKIQYRPSSDRVVISE